MTDRPTLGALGQVYVTQAAARTYAEAQGLGQEHARRELTQLLLGAHCTQEADGDRPAAFRRRSRALGIDVTARVTQEGGLLVVVAVGARPR